MVRYWRVWKTFISSSLVREMEFRANFAAKILQNGMWIGFSLLILLVIYGNTDSVAGWSRGDALVLTATAFLLSAVSQAFFFSVYEIPGQIRMGLLDFVLTKPIDSQFWVSTRRFNFDQIGTVIAGIAMLAVGLAQAESTPGFDQWAAYIVLGMCGLAMYYSFILALMTTGIWLVRVDNLWALAESVVQVSRYPVDIYNAGIQRFLTFVVPLAFFATIPTRQLVRAFDAQMLSLGLVWAVVSLTLASALWRFALRFYGSASS